MKKILVIAAAMAFLAVGRPLLSAQDTGISGKWHFVLETPGGDREVDADLAVDADGNVTGKWGNAEVAGTYKDGELALEFQFTSEEVGATAPMKIDGKLDEKAALTGGWAFSEYNGTYTATRPRALAPDADPATAAPATAPSSPASDPKPSPPDPKPDPQ